MNLKRALYGVALACAALFPFATAPAQAAGMWQDWPAIGYASYCAAIVGSSNVQAGQTGQGTGGAAGVGSNGVYCAQTVPAGPAVFTGAEYLPADIGPLGGVTGSSPSSAAVGILQLGQGPLIDNNVAGAAQTIPNGTSFFVLDTNTPTTVAVTFPAVAVEGQEVHLLCGIAISVALSVVANTGQTVKGAAPSTCTAGQGFAWRYVASATGALSSATWIRMY